MSDYEPLVRRRDVDVEEPQPLDQLVVESKKADLPLHLHIPLSTTTTPTTISKSRTVRVASLDVFRGLSVLLMMLVDYGGSVFPIIAHSPWNGVHLADFVMPFFLFVAGVSLAIVYKKVSNKAEATWNVVIRTAKLFFIGVLLQGGYLHGITSMTYGVDIERIRWLGILQRIAISYLVAALCEIWLQSRRCRGECFLRSYVWHWGVMLLICAVHMGLLYGLYVPDWKFRLGDDDTIYVVKCSVRGDLGPACNSAGMIDRYILGINHLYQKPVYKNLKVCNASYTGLVSETAPSWCFAPFDPEGILSSLTAAVSCIIGLQYGHILVKLQDHKERLYNWFFFSIALIALGLILSFIGIPLNKTLYTVSYLLVTSAASGLTFCILYILVDVYGWRSLAFGLEWMGKHSLSIFILVTSNIAVIAIQGFYWKAPENNIVHWIVSLVVHR